MSVELRKREAAEEWLAAGLCLLRLEPPTPNAVLEASPWLLATQAETGALPPPAVVADVGRLLTSGLRDWSAAPQTPSERLRGAVRLYEDQFLGRLASESRVEAAADALARLPRELKEQAVAVLVASILERIRFGAGVSIAPGTTRRVIQRPTEEFLRAGFETLRADAEVLETIADGYEDLVRKSRHAGSLVTDADVFALENLTVLKSLTQRLSIQQMVEVAEELEKGLPRRIKRRASTGNRTPTKVEDEDQYPIGGFSAMSTSGSIENLVTSELIYMDEVPDPETVDLFDLRYVEGELLYYTRDESVYVRSKRVITFALPAALVEARFKDPGLRWQRLVVVLGAILSLVRRMSEWLSDEGLLFRVVFVKDAAGGTPLDAEKALCELLLREWIEKGTAEIADARSIAAVVADAGTRAKHAQSDLVVFGDTPLADVDKRVQAILVDVSHASPRIRVHAKPAPAPDPTTSPWSDWQDTLKTLATLLV